MLLYHFPLTSSSATATIVNKGLKDDYTISGDNNFSSGGKLSAYAKDMGENKFYLSIPNFSLDYTLCFRAKATSNTLLVSVGYTSFEITADNTWHDYVICDKKVHKDGLFLTNYNYSAGIVAFGDSEDSCQGLIQDIRIYDYALSQAEINEYSRALVVHYPLQGNELNPSVLKDVSGFGDDYISDSAITYGYDSPRNKYGVVTKDLLLKKGILVNIRQLVENYDFSDGLNGWVAKPSNTNMSIVDGHLHYSSDNTSTINALTPDVKVTNVPDGYKHWITYRFHTNNSQLTTKLTVYINGYDSGTVQQNIDFYSSLGTTNDLITSSNFINNWPSWLKDYVVISVGKYAQAIEFDVYKGNIFDRTNDFGKNNEPSNNEMYEMLGITEADFISYGNYVVKDTRKTIPKTLSFWCKYNSTWCHLAYNGDRYVNGEINTDLFNTIYASLEDNINMSDFRVYATALSAEDIKNLYDSPIAVSNHQQTIAFEFVEGNDGFSANKNGIVQHNDLREAILYPSKYWRTPTYAEMYYIFNTRTNASNLRTLGRVQLDGGNYVNGAFILPDNCVLPSGVTMIITISNYTTNVYSLSEFELLENAGVVFWGWLGYRSGSSFVSDDICRYWSGMTSGGSTSFYIEFKRDSIPSLVSASKMIGRAVRLCKKGSSFSVSATEKIDFAPANLQYHCTQHIWRFAEHSYDIIGADNKNIGDSYNGWIDLFGYGTSGINNSPTLHTTNNADYASGDITNTDNDWGVNEIQSYEYNQQLNGIYKDKILTNKLIED